MKFYRFDMGAAAERQKKLPAKPEALPGAFFAFGTRGGGIEQAGGLSSLKAKKEFTKAAGQAAAPPAGGLGCSCGLRFPIQQFQCVVVTMDIIQHAIKHGLFVAI